MFLHPCTLIIVTINSGKYNQTPRVAPLRAVHTDCDGHVLRSQCLRSRHWSLGAACTRASDGRAHWRQRRPAQGRGVHLPGSAARCAAVARRAVGARGDAPESCPPLAPGEGPHGPLWWVFHWKCPTTSRLREKRLHRCSRLPPSPHLASPAVPVVFPPAPTLSLSVTTSKCFL